MGSERLSHEFTIKDPTYKGESSSAEHSDRNSSSHSMFHTSGTQPVSVSNGPKSTAKKSHHRKSNSKYTKLSKLYNRQLSYIGTTLESIERISKSSNRDQNNLLIAYKKRADKLNEQLNNLRNASSSFEDQNYFDQIKSDIEQLINEIKTYKMEDDHLNSKDAVDYLVGFPLDVSDSEENGEEKTLVYF